MTKNKNHYKSNIQKTLSLSFLFCFASFVSHAEDLFVGSYTFEKGQKDFVSSLQITQVLVNNNKTDEYMVNLRFHEGEQSFCEMKDEFFRLEGEQLVLRKKIDPVYLDEGDSDACVLVIKLDKSKKEIQFVDKDLICRKEFCSQIFDFDEVKFSTETRKLDASLVSIF